MTHQKDSPNVMRYDQDGLKVTLFTMSFDNDVMPSGLLPGSATYIQDNVKNKNHYLFMELQTLVVFKYPLTCILNETYLLTFENAYSHLYKAFLNTSEIELKNLNTYLIKLEYRNSNESVYHTIEIPGQFRINS